MATLYIFYRSPFSAPEIGMTLKLAKPEDGILLIQDAVFLLRSWPAIGIEEGLMKDLKFYALKQDMDARSVRSIAGVKAIGYDDLVELLTEYDNCFS
jgi:sulfur relay protein TusB/DsrH